MEALRTLFDAGDSSGVAVLPEPLLTLYGGDLRFSVPAERPYVIGNFVSTLDGVVSYGMSGKSGGSEISGFNEEDRFIMGLLRASADAVMVGAATLEEVPARHLWTAQSIYPRQSNAYREYRQDILRKPIYPLNVIVTGSGKLALHKAVFRTPDLRTLVITTPKGREYLGRAGAGALPSMEVRAVDAPNSRLTASAILELLRREFGISLLLHEGGPTLFGSFVAEGLIDEYFLTIAPQIAGRNTSTRRPGMIAGVEFTPESAPWLSLASIKQSGYHLYLRYRRAQP